MSCWYLFHCEWVVFLKPKYSIIALICAVFGFIIIRISSLLEFLRMGYGAVLNGSIRIWEICKKQKRRLVSSLLGFVFVALTGVEPVTQGFSVLCSTN